MPKINAISGELFTSNFQKQMDPYQFSRLSLKKETAIVLAGFGTTSRSMDVYQKLEQDLRTHFPDHKITWAYTSDVIRKKLNLPGILDALSTLEREGYRKVLVQPLHVFPGTEYRTLKEVCESFPKLRVRMGETFSQRWSYIERLLEALSSDFLPPGKGWNFIMGHGSPLTCEPVNVVYQGMEKFCRQLYENCRFATVEGIPSTSMLLKEIQRANFIAQGPKARIFPFMLVSGKHVEEDLLVGDTSFKHKLESLGFEVDFPTLKVNGELRPKALGHTSILSKELIKKVQHALDWMDIS